MTKKTRLIYEKSDKKNNADKNHYIKKTNVLWMPISVGQDYHELNKLIESMRLINKNFINTTLLKVIIVDLAQSYHWLSRVKLYPKVCTKKQKKMD